VVVAIGSAIVRDVVVMKARTYCFPGAPVRDIDHQVPGAMEMHPNQLKDYFRGLIGRLKETGKWVLISGSLPTIECFSHLLSLHYWLKSYCSSMNLEYIENVYHFWERRQFYKSDGFHTRCWQVYKIEHTAMQSP
uniref:Uncharacterized protein n=1 Tax=Salmo trutta TaxID=8032 RepID=A0A674EBC0_SALTR